MADSVVSCFEQAQAAIAAGQVDRAGQLYLQVTDFLKPQEHRRWGELFQQAGQWDWAETLLRRLARQHPTMPEAWTDLGTLLVSRDQLPEAQTCFAKAHRLRDWPESGDRGYWFSRDWFSNQLPNWVNWVQPLADRGPVQALEVGSFEGMSACWLLDRVLLNPEARLTCIEPEIRPTLRDNLDRTGRAPQVTLLSQLSWEALAQLPVDHYDLAYIDGCHAPWVAFRDAVMTWPLVKVGGLVVIDDYRYVGLPEDCPQFGVDLFMLLFTHCFEVVFSGYQLFLRKVRDWQPLTAPWQRAAEATTDPLLLDALAWALARSHQWDAAQQLCERAIGLAPQVAAPYLTLAEIWAQRQPEFSDQDLAHYGPLTRSLVQIFGHSHPGFALKTLPVGTGYDLEPLVAYLQALEKDTYWHEPIANLLTVLERQGKQQGMPQAMAAWLDRLHHPPAGSLALPHRPDLWRLIGDLAIGSNNATAAALAYRCALH